MLHRKKQVQVQRWGVRQVSQRAAGWGRSLLHPRPGPVLFLQAPCSRSRPNKHIAGPPLRSPSTPGAAPPHSNWALECPHSCDSPTLCPGREPRPSALTQHQIKGIRFVDTPRLKGCPSYSIYYFERLAFRKRSRTDFENNN